MSKPSDGIPAEIVGGEVIYTGRVMKTAKFQLQSLNHISLDIAERQFERVEEIYGPTNRIVSFPAGPGGLMEVTFSQAKTLLSDSSITM